MSTKTEACWNDGPKPHGAEQLPDADELQARLKSGIERSIRRAGHKAALKCALDSAINVVVEARQLLRDDPDGFSSGDRQTIAVTLEQMGRVCYSVARECERPAKKEGA